MRNKRRVLVSKGGTDRALILEVGGTIDNKYIVVSTTEDNDTITLLHLAKRILLKNVTDLCSE